MVHRSVRTYRTYPFVSWHKVYVYTLFLTLWSSFSYVTHSTVNFVPYVSDSNLSPKTLEKSQNSKLKNIEMKQAPH
jgi:hypothetical protein